jgi:UDP-glucose 4-epimerase
VRELLARGIPVRVFDRNDSRFRENLARLPGVEMCLGDVSNRGEVDSALAGVDSVVHAAHTTVPASSMKDISFDLTSNIPPLMALLQDLGRHSGLRTLVYLSSGGTVYGNPGAHHPISEDHPTTPISSYGLTKLIAEHYIRLCLSGTAVSAFVLRVSNAYGERQDLMRPQGVIGHFLKSLHDDRPVAIYGDGSVVRDYVHAADVASAILHCLLDDPAKPAGVRTFNVGSGYAVTLNELVNLIELVTGRPLTVHRYPDRTFDCQYNVLDCSAIRNALGWTPQIPLQVGLELTWQWLRNAAQVHTT